jgi:thiamine biosynthesis lipoprotein
MTQYYAYSKFTLVNAPRQVKVLLTCFSVVVLVALAVGVINYWDKTGLTPRGAVAWYRGNEGRELDPGESMTFEKTFRELLDATHPHLFGQGLLLFVLSHIVALTGLSEKRKMALYIVSFGAMLLDAAVPWLIRYVSPDLAPLQIVTILLLTLAFALQVILPIREMWFVKPSCPVEKLVPPAKSAMVLLLAGAGLALSALEPPAARADTTVHHRATIVGDDSTGARDGFAAAWAELAAVDSAMSLYRPASELVRVNREAAGRPVAISRRTFDVLLAARALSDASNGAFDVTVKPALDLWGFYRKASRRPAPMAVDSVRALVDWRRVELDAAARTVRFTAPGTAIDLGGIAKGYALDRALDALAARGLHDALLNLGGQIAARGAPPESPEGWIVGVRDPLAPDSLVATVLLADESIASSGGYERFVVLDGVSYGHIIDPRRADPVTDVAGVSVIAKRAIEADALATALCVLGADGVDVLGAAFPGLEALVAARPPGTRNFVYTAAGRFAPEPQLLRGRADRATPGSGESHGR